MTNASPTTRESPSASRPLHILLAEDEANTRHSMALILRRAGHRVILAENASVLLFILETMTEEERRQVDLLVTDLFMPGLKGEALIREMDARGYFLPVVVISACSSQELEAEFRRRGNISFLQKPFYALELVAAVETAAREYVEKQDAETPRRKASEGET